MTNEIHDRNHELLCAYVLGEVNEAERAEVDALLAGSSELRAEKARLEATIGLIQGALEKDEGLSTQARESVLRAVVPPPPVRSIWQRTWVRAAASVMFVSLALGGWAVYQRQSAEPLVLETAKLDSRAAVGDERLQSKELAQRDADGKFHGPGDTVPAGGGGEREARAASAPRAAPLDSLAKAGELQGDKSKSEAPPAELQEKIDRFVKAHEESLNVRKLADAQVPASQPVDEVTRRLYGAEQAGASDGSTASNLARPSVSSVTLAQEVPGDPASGAKDLVAYEEEVYTGTSIGVGAGPSSPAPSGPTSAGPSGPPSVGSVTTGGSGGAGAAPTAFRGRHGGLGKDVRANELTKARSDGLAPGFVAGDDSAFLGTSSNAVKMPQLSAPAEKKDEGLARAQLGRLGYDSGDDRDNLERDLNVEQTLSDEDRFILEKLGIARPEWSSAVRTLTPEVRTRYRGEYIDHWCRHIVDDCRRRPNERPRDMFFRFWGDNPFELAQLDALSTFSADVDTASYALARRYLNEGHLPEKAQIRTEEFVNYFKADVPPPQQGTFAIYTTLAPSRFGNAGPTDTTATQRDLLRVVIRGKDVPKAERKPMALTFVVDCSGSMKEQNRMEMVKHAMRLLVSQLDARDSIAIVKFSTDAALVLPMTSAANKPLIESAIYPLQADGSTNSEAGLRMGYSAALAGLNVEATNRVVFLSDGVANVGITDANVISEGVKSIREKGVYLNTVGVGMNNHNDVLLEQLADKGDGVCNYVDSPEEAKKVFVDDLTGALETIARDVKLQVEFDPAQVMRYRLLGYENRAIADADFRNDKVDAGEVGAGHQVTALYEIEYANPNAASEKPLATVRVRFKAPRNPGAPTANEEASEISQPVTLKARTSWEGAGPGYRRSTLVAQFAEFLRRSIHARNDSFDSMLADAKKLEGEEANKEFSELVTLMEKSKALILASTPQRDELALTIDKVRESCILRAQLEQLARESDREMLAELEHSNRILEDKLRELLRRRLEQPR